MRDIPFSLGLYGRDIYSPQMHAIAKEIKGLLLTKGTKRQIGLLLLQVRNHLKQDKLFGKWRSLNFNDQLLQPTAYNYMTLASFPADTGNIPESCLYILAKKENELVRDEVFEQLITRDKVTGQDTHDAIADAKGEERRTWKSARDKNDDERIDTMWRMLCGMSGYCVERLVSLIADQYGRSTVREWLEESPTPAPVPAAPVTAAPAPATPAAQLSWAETTPPKGTPLWVREPAGTPV